MSTWSQLADVVVVVGGRSGRDLERGGRGWALFLFRLSCSFNYNLSAGADDIITERTKN